MSFETYDLLCTLCAFDMFTLHSLILTRWPVYIQVVYQIDRIRVCVGCQTAQSPIRTTISICSATSIQSPVYHTPDN